MILWVWLVIINSRVVGYQNDFRSDQSKRITVLIGNIMYCVWCKITMLHHWLLFPLWTSKCTLVLWIKKPKANCLILRVHIKCAHCSFFFSFFKCFCVRSTDFNCTKRNVSFLWNTILRFASVLFTRKIIHFTVRFERTWNFNFFFTLVNVCSTLDPYECIFYSETLCTRY